MQKAEAEAAIRGLAEDPGFGDALRLCDGIGISLRDGRIIVENQAIGGQKAFSRGAIPILELFMKWTTPVALVNWARPWGQANADMNSHKPKIALIARAPMTRSFLHQDIVGPLGAGARGNDLDALGSGRDPTHAPQRTP